MRVLVTGGCGFIGANLCHYLVSRGISKLCVRVLDDLSEGREEYLGVDENGFEIIRGDVRDTHVTMDAVRNVDAVVHLAAKTSVVDSTLQPEETYEVNAAGTLRLLEACRSHGVKRFVFASSNAVLGEQAPPAHEQLVPEPISPYGASKLAGEALCRAYSATFGLQTVVLRFANVYGPLSGHKTSVVARFVRQILRGETLTVYGDGRQIRDFVHVDDVCQAIERALQWEPASHVSPVFQIGSGMGTSICELIEILSALAEAQLGVRPDVTYAPPRTGEILENYSCIDRARRLLGYSPRVALADGLASLWFSHARES